MFAVLLARNAYKAAGEVQAGGLAEWPSEAYDGRCWVRQGIVTQVTDVKPLITVATYLDDISGAEVYQEITSAPLASATGHGMSGLRDKPGW